jgi:hypothetical protein
VRGGARIGPEPLGLPRRGLGAFKVVRERSPEASARRWNRPCGRGPISAPPCTP